jgi:hypothetical protein
MTQQEIEELVLALNKIGVSRAAQRNGSHHTTLCSAHTIEADAHCSTQHVCSMCSIDRP